MAGHPLLTDLLLALALVPLLWRLPVSGRQLAEKAGVGLASLALALYGAVLAFYLTSPQFLDHLEPMVASTSWALVQGRPLYHDPQSAERYSILYGPLLYMFTAVPMRIFGPSLLSAKLGSALAALGSFSFLSYALLKKEIPRPRRISLLGWLALALLVFPAAGFWIRSELWMLFFSSAALALALAFRPLAGSVACGLLMGILSGLKLHAAIYALPALALVFTRGGYRVLVVSFLSFWITVALPFVIEPDLISAKNFLFWFNLTREHGVSLASALSNLEWGVFLIAAVGPALLLLVGARRETRIFWLGLSVTLLLACYTGSLKGAGRYHLLPWLPSLILGFALLLQEYRRLPLRAQSVGMPFALASFLSLAVLAYRHTGDQLRELQRLPGKEIAAELVSIARSYPGKAIEMGYGAHYALSFYRPLLVFEKNLPLLDGAALMDMQSRGLATPAATRERILHCDPPLWIFPRGEEPLLLRHPAPPYPMIFGPEVRAEFLWTYHVIESRKFYSVWGCRPKIG